MNKWPSWLNIEFAAIQIGGATAMAYMAAFVHALPHVGPDWTLLALGTALPPYGVITAYYMYLDKRIGRLGRQCAVTIWIFASLVTAGVVQSYIGYLAPLTSFTKGSIAVMIPTGTLTVYGLVIYRALMKRHQHLNP